MRNNTKQCLSTASASVKPGKAEIRVANRLRELRRDKGMTLKSLAARVGLSDAFLSRVENYKCSIPIAGLEQISEILNVPLAAFFEEDARTVPITVCQVGRGKKGRVRGSKGFDYWMLAAEKKGKLMEPLYVEVTKQSRPTPLQHSGDQFDYVLEGECRLIYGKQEILLQTGDSAYYDATVPHTRLLSGDQPCRLLVIVASRDYLFHGDLRQLLGEAAG